MRNLLRYIFCLLLLSLVACHEGGAGVDDEQISVTLKLATGEVTRSVTDSPSDASSWSQAERAVDGRYIYSLSVYIVDAARNVVASKDVVVDNQATEVVVEFDKSYNLKRGVHTLMAVANNVDHSIGGTTLSSGTVGQWAAGSYDNLMGNKISANSSFVSPKDIIQPLSLMKKFEIHAGDNFVEGELTRTIARLRIEVKNNSGSLPLKINNITFSNNFAQKETYVFDDGSDRKYSSQRGAIVATSDKALQPFVCDAGKAYKTIASQTSAVVYDGYQLESKVAANEEFAYTLNMTYEGSSVPSATFSRESDKAINKVKDLKTGAEDYYLIYNPTTGKYLSVSDGNVTTASISNFTSIAARNIWQFTQEGDYYYIKNVNSESYLNAKSNPVVVNASKNRFKLNDNQVANAITIMDYDASSRYIYIDGEAVKSAYSSGYSTVGFNFYKVKKTQNNALEDINREIKIPLTSIDPVTQQSSKVTAIKRNDFINVLVTVSYNPTSGEFDFRVEDWDTGGGQVEFN